MVDRPECALFQVLDAAPLSREEEVPRVHDCKGKKGRELETTCLLDKVVGQETVSKK